MNCSDGLCALFCVWKGSDSLKNKAFTRQTNEEKRQHLSAVLKHVTSGSMDDEMIRRILPKVAIHKQYTVSAFSSLRAFQEAVARAQMGSIKHSVLFSQAWYGPIAVIITPLKTNEMKKGRRAIYIYAPNRFVRKGALNWTGAKKNA